MTSLFDSNELVNSDDSDSYSISSKNSYIHVTDIGDESTSRTSFLLFDSEYTFLSDDNDVNYGCGDCTTFRDQPDISDNSTEQVDIVDSIQSNETEFSTSHVDTTLAYSHSDSDSDLGSESTDHESVRVLTVSNHTEDLTTSDECADSDDESVLELAASNITDSLPGLVPIVEDTDDESVRVLAVSNHTQDLATWSECADGDDESVLELAASIISDSLPGLIPIEEDTDDSHELPNLDLHSLHDPLDTVVQDKESGYIPCFPCLLSAGVECEDDENIVRDIEQLSETVRKRVENVEQVLLGLLALWS